MVRELRKALDSAKGLQQVKERHDKRIEDIINIKQEVLDFVRRYLNKLVAAIYKTSLSSTKKLCPHFQMGR